MPDEAEPPIREFADRGVLWLLESTQNLADLVRLIAEEIARRLDFTQAERVNRSFIPENLHKQEADLIYRVPFQQGKGAVWVYVLVEHQSRPDRTMGLRLLSYMVQLWETQRRGFQDAKIPVSKWRLHPIIPVVFYSGKRRWTSPLSVAALMDLPDLLAEFVPTFRTLQLKLQETPPETLSGSALALALRTLQASDAPKAELSEVLRGVVRELETLPESSKVEWRRALLFVYLLIQHKRGADEQDLLVEAVEEVLEASHRIEVKEVLMTGAQALEAKGRREGRVEGRLEGRREMLLEQLLAKFGSLSNAQEARLNTLDKAQMEKLSLRLLAANTLEELDL